MTSGQIAGKAIRKTLTKLNEERTISIHIPPQDKLNLICGKRISNNYFKINGGIMRRKGERKRKKWKY